MPLQALSGLYPKLVNGRFWKLVIVVVVVVVAVARCDV